jgi:hypothetical protein
MRGRGRGCGVTSGASWWWTVAAIATVLLATVPVAAAGAKYYFRLGETKAGPDVDAALKAYAGEVLRAELASRAEWASDIDAQSTDALVAELGKRRLRGFDVTVRMDALKYDVKDPSPGGRWKRLSVDVRLAVFGTTIPEAKMAFSGDGQATLESEVPDKRMDTEKVALAKDAIKDAVKQAVDQAVMRLAPGKATTMNAAKRTKKK